MTLSNRIRAAALGPTPRTHQEHLAAWMPRSPEGHIYYRVRGYCDTRRYQGGPLLRILENNTQRRMFLLFVAEALENP